MTRAALSVGIAWLFLWLGGCGAGGSVSTASAGGGRISNNNGHVTGNIGAINVTLEVREAGSNSAGSRHSSRTSQGPGTQQRSEYQLWEITAGKVVVQFERAGHGPISLKIDDEDYGSIAEGDDLLIDERRQVFINGTQRESAPPTGR